MTHPAIAIAAGVALVLFALRFLRKGVDRLLEERGGRWARQVTGNPGGGFLFGFAAACLMPSSSGLAALTTRLSREPQATLTGTFAMTLGANVGTTSLVLAGASGIAQAWPWMLLLGVLLFQGTRSEISRGIGQLLLSMALVFLGLDTITVHAAAIRSGDARLLIEISTHHPLAMALATGLLALVMQSSTATLLLVIGIAAGLGTDVARGAVLPAVVGVNAGIACTAVTIGWSHPSSRHPALANAAIKVLLALTMLLVDPLLPEPAGDPGWMAAIEHLEFNLVAAAVGLIGAAPLLAATARWAGTTGNRLAPRYLDHAGSASDPRLALATSSREILRIADAVRAMLAQLQVAWRTGDRRRAKAASADDDITDALDAAVRDHLATYDEAQDPAIRNECLRQLRYVIALESAGDVIESQLAETVATAIACRDGLGEEGARCISAALAQGERVLLLAEAAFTTRDLQLAQRLRNEDIAASQMVRDLQETDPLRRRAGMPHSSNATLDDLAQCIQRIVSAVAVVAIEGSREPGPRTARYFRRAPTAEAQFTESALETAACDPATIAAGPATSVPG